MEQEWQWQQHGDKARSQHPRPETLPYTMCLTFTLFYHRKKKQMTKGKGCKKNGLISWMSSNVGDLKEWTFQHHERDCLASTLPMLWMTHFVSSLNPLLLWKPNNCGSILFFNWRKTTELEFVRVFTMCVCVVGLPAPDFCVSFWCNWIRNAFFLLERCYFEIAVVARRAINRKWRGIFITSKRIPHSAIQ